MAVEANIFRLTGLETLSQTYRVYRVHGLNRADDEYFQNRDQLVRRLNYDLRTPCLPFESDGELDVVIRGDAPPPPQTLPMVGCSVALEATGTELKVDFLSLDPHLRRIALRFINFLVNRPLYDDSNLWQPSSGGAFFTKQPRTEDGLDLFSGFLVRSISLPDGKIGLCVDARLKFVSTGSLPANLSRHDFRPLQGGHFVYRYGPRWLDIRAELLTGSPAERLSFRDDDGSIVNLASHIKKLTNGRHDPTGSGVVKYYNNRGDERMAPLTLCHLVHDTESDRVKRIFHRAIPSPSDRRAAIVAFVSQRLKHLRLGDTVITVDPSPAKISTARFSVPDAEFGHGRMLTLRNRPDATQTDLNGLGSLREKLLLAPEAGFLKAAALGRQYLVLPRSYEQTFGPTYAEHLKDAVHRLLPKGNYAPNVVYYDDTVRGNFAQKGQYIIDAIKETKPAPGHALIMVHRDQGRAKRTEEKLAAYLVRNLRPEIHAAVNHSVAAARCYECRRDGTWGVRAQEATRFRSYLHNVALSKILLTNGRWPYVLAQPLHADFVVGIDVKQFTAGFVGIAGGGRIVTNKCDRSQQLECLSSAQVKRLFMEVADACLRPEDRLPRQIVIHRDGRIFQSELTGLEAALLALKAKGLVADDAKLTVVEIAKHSLIPVRFFETSPQGTQSPTIGTYLLADDATGYVATTGQPFRSPGTPNPLCVRVAHGEMPVSQCLEDVFALSSLAWSQPRNCTRYPITLKLADRFLAEIGAEYDENEPLTQSPADE